MNALHLAEQATLGALMLDPDLPTQTAGWLRPEDFADPWHAQVHTVIRELAAARRSTGPNEVGRALIDRLGHRVADVPRILDLLQAAPLHAAGREYGAFVVEQSIRRQVAAFGVLLNGVALNAASSGSAKVLDTVTRQVDALAQTAERRHFAATGASSWRAVLDPPCGPGTAVLPLQLAADRAVSAHPLPSREDIACHEADLVAALVNRPERTPEVAGWLHADALTSDAWRPVYQAVVRLHDTGRRVDEVTVAWELHRASGVHGPGPSIQALRQQVADASILDVGIASRVVAGDQLRLAAERAAQALRIDAANPGLDVRDLLGTVGPLTAALRSTAAHLEPILRAAPRADVVPSPPSLRLVEPEAVLSR